jgi:hypothetical protein
MANNIPFTPPSNQVPSGPPAHAIAVTPSDTAVLASLSRYIYVGGEGDLAVLMAGDDTPVTLKAVPVGTYLPLCVQKVMATNTSATLIVALW